MYTMGVDIGSTASKGVILRDGKHIVSSSTIPVGTGTSGPVRVIKELFEKSQLSKDDIKRIVATGYGRMNFDYADKQVSELSCHAKGAYSIFPNVRTIIDIGGQDAKVLKLNSRGRLMNFVMNDKCAAGTGRFLDVMANVLEVKISDLSKLAGKSESEVDISSTCTVFAESEVISHLSEGKKPEDIAAGIHRSIARRVSSLAKRIGIEKDVTMTGGVAQNSSVVGFMESEIGLPISVSEHAQIIGALGAAIYAWEEINK
ncbi:2-hydroxyglutaryl-CoA dehydratase [Clostridium tyrobutyricum]|jgi:predicted CoA-substrate-specific enzyme activase|uniref:Benzoyl-CoA reductase subunit BadG n=1 Tax=Clostridium tyrobutyricum DIVETGP TaxID=1408889 RepID=W6NGK8_CLOTY|nr:acyl-CoA dehydratase activase [Clostridium tyrobutyricum]AND83946.1 (R)-phenyllactate dehydratase activator [Clostridium tyrobutyricum]ANP68685.1 2-hydroxyglutaryl-CoA dehydratase [Clostridium tyrobutyricum]MBR9647106.1 2-hydroxyglutaryl-CoA dehydratase [Clostridium tyrobutyricum]MBV4415688.1 2-hydroxyglutaryl-CoA dehydratase [Clostridium tyrobutyricum]MBV4423544.1 2-hydroxyglutaryl-CoA dehydratase [Clostridium tyrobutyricum]